jgi:hypothetical protein
MPSQTDSTSIDYLALAEQLKKAQDDQQLFRAIVDTPFNIHRVQTTFLFLGIIVLLQVNKETNTIDRVALSDTELAKNTTDVSMVPFEEIKIPCEDQENIIAATINDKKSHDTTDWKFLFTPALTAEQARVNQASAGIAYSAVYPVPARDGGALIFSYFQYLGGINEAQRDFMENYARVVTEALKA